MSLTLPGLYCSVSSDRKKTNFQHDIFQISTRGNGLPNCATFSAFPWRFCPLSSPALRFMVTWGKVGKFGWKIGIWSISQILGTLAGLPIAGCLGDQQAALLGHNCLEIGDTKNTYGTGTFMLSNIGTNMIVSKNGLITTVGFQVR